MVSHKNQGFTQPSTTQDTFLNLAPLHYPGISTTLLKFQVTHAQLSMEHTSLGLLTHSGHTAGLSGPSCSLMVIGDKILLLNNLPLAPSYQRFSTATLTPHSSSWATVSSCSQGNYHPCCPATMPKHGGTAACFCLPAHHILL